MLTSNDFAKDVVINDRPVKVNFIVPDSRVEELPPTRGIVVDAAGNPVEGATVSRLSFRDETVQSDSSGRFEFGITLERKSRLRARKGCCGFSGSDIQSWIDRPSRASRNGALQSASGSSR